MISLERTRHLLQHLLGKSRGSPSRKLALMIFGMSIGISLVYTWRKKRIESKIAQNEKWPTLDEIIDTIESNVAHREITDAINKTKVWGAYGDAAVIEDIILARQVREYAEQMGMDVAVISGDGDDGSYDDD